MLRFPQDANTNKKFPDQFCPLLLILSFPHHIRMLCLLHKFILKTKSHSASNSPHWDKLDTFQAWCDMSHWLYLFDRNAAPETCPTSAIQTHFPSFILLLKSKGKRTPSHPTFSLVHMRRSVTWHVQAGEWQRVWKLRQISHPTVDSDAIPADYFYHHKMLSIFICAHTFPHYIDISMSAIEEQNNIYDFYVFPCNGP